MRKSEIALWFGDKWRKWKDGIIETIIMLTIISVIAFAAGAFTRWVLEERERTVNTRYDAFYGTMVCPECEESGIQAIVWGDQEFTQASCTVPWGDEALFVRHQDELYFMVSPCTGWVPLSTVIVDREKR